MTETAASHIPAPLWRRLAAAAYDSLLIVALWFPAAALFLLLTHGKVPSAEAPLLLVFRLYLLAVAFAFFGGFWVYRGQTLGMLAWKVRVTRSVDGARISWFQALIRFICACVPWSALLLAGAVQEYAATWPTPFHSLGYISEFFGVAVVVLVFRRAPLRAGGVTWYDRASGTALVMAPSIAELSRQG